MEELLKQVGYLWKFKKIELIHAYPCAGNKAVYLIGTDKGKFIMFAFGKFIREDDIIRYTQALAYLNSKALKVAPRILEDKDGDFYREICDKYVYIMEYVDSSRELTLNPEDEYKLGRITALLHSFDDCEAKCGMPPIDQIVAGSYEKLKDYPWKSELYEVIDSLSKSNNYKQTFIHVDLSPHHALIDKDNKVFLIDFDNCGKGSIYMDVGYHIIANFVHHYTPGQFIIYNESATAFFEGYSSVSKLEYGDKQLIYDATIIRMLQRIEYYKSGSPYDGIKKLEFLIAHKDDLIASM
jgi:Ser/Thr protein kinase RdoA (MazF antagonist)